MAQRTLDRFEEGSLLSQDHAFRLRQGEVLLTIWVGPQFPSICLVCGKRLKGDEGPGHVVGPLVWKKVADEVPAAARDDARPIVRIFGERLALEWIDLVSNKAGNGH